jgi:hypothetical protein
MWPVLTTLNTHLPHQSKTLNTHLPHQSKTLNTHLINQKQQKNKTKDDAELEARLAKLKAAKGATTDQEKRAARAARTGGAVKPVGGKAAGPAYDFSNETLLWEGGPARGDLVFNVALGATLVWLPLTFGAVGRAAFVKYRFTDRRLSVRDTLPWSGAPWFFGGVVISGRRVARRGHFYRQRVFCLSLCHPNNSN